MLLKRAAKFIAESDYAIAFTGAGISAESGIPTFRGKGGLWEKYDPNEYATVDALLKNPKKVWNLFVEIFYLIKNSKPNPAHYTLTELEKIGLLKATITQNIDDLHERAGTKNVIKLHGNYNILRCDNCGYRTTISEIDEKNLPKCPSCNSHMRPDIVLFGESLPRGELEKAFKESEKADLIITIGTSGVIMPAAIIPYIVKDHGGVVIEINYEPSGITHLADVSLFGKAGEILPKLLEEIKNYLDILP